MPNVSHRFSDIIHAIYEKHDVEYVRDIHRTEDVFVYEGSIKCDEPELTPKRVSVKIVLTDNEDAQTFFDQEAQLYSQLHHKNIVHFEFSSLIPINHQGKVRRCIVTEYIDGLNLVDVLQYLSARGQEVGVEQSLFIIKEVLEGLNYVHRKKDETGQSLSIVHRDISLKNIMITRSGEVKIIDFGVATAAKTDEVKIAGTYSYMSPEQAEGHVVDHKTDLYAISVVLLELISNHILRPSEKEAVLKKLSIDGSLKSIMLKGLASEPRKRFQSADSMLQALDDYFIEKRLYLRSNELAHLMEKILSDNLNTTVHGSKLQEVIYPNAATRLRRLLMKYVTYFIGIAVAIGFFLYLKNNDHHIEYVSESNPLAKIINHTPIQNSDIKVQEPISKQAINTEWSTSIRVEAQGAHIFVQSGQQKWNKMNELEIKDSVSNDIKEKSFSISVNRKGYKSIHKTIVITPDNPNYHNSFRLEKSQMGSLTMSAYPWGIISVPGYITKKEIPPTVNVILPEGQHTVEAQWQNDKGKWFSLKSQITIKPHIGHTCIINFKDKMNVICK